MCRRNSYDNKTKKICPEADYTHIQSSEAPQLCRTLSSLISYLSLVNLLARPALDNLTAI